MNGNLDGLECYKHINGIFENYTYDYPDKIKITKWYKEATEVYLISSGKWVEGELIETLKRIK